ncbi:MAG: hypothetical protein ACE5EI_08440, partial [Thermodesulfobacteriota bacterium]
GGGTDPDSGGGTDPDSGGKKLTPTQALSKKLRIGIGKVWSALGGNTGSDGKGLRGAGGGIRGITNPDATPILELTDEEMQELSSALIQGLINPGDSESGTRPDSYRERVEGGIEKALDPLILTDEEFGSGPGSTGDGRVPQDENPFGTLTDPGLDTGITPPPGTDPNNPSEGTPTGTGTTGGDGGER